MKTKFILILAASLIVGFLIAKYTGQEESSTSATEQVSEPNNASEISAESEAASLEAAPKGAQEASGFIEENPGSPQAQDQTKTEFNLTPELVTELEQSATDLPKQVKLTRIDGGWKVGKIRPGSLFEKTGLKEGDLVMDQELLAFKNSNPANAELATRTAKLLDQIATY